MLPVCGADPVVAPRRLRGCVSRRVLDLCEANAGIQERLVEAVPGKMGVEAVQLAFIADQRRLLAEVL